MNTTENYTGEDLLDEDLLDESFIDEYPLDEDIEYEDFDEARRRRRRPAYYRPIKGVVPTRIAQAANFGSRVQGRSVDYVTKSELKNSLDNISREVNELKKTSISNSKLITALDKKHSELAKIEFRKTDNQSSVLRNMQMMSMFGAILNQPTLNTEKLTIIDNKIKPVDNQNPIETDMMKSMLLPMITTMGGGSGGSTDMMMPLMLILMMDKDKSKNDKDNTMLFPMMFMMMSQGKK